MSVQLRPRIRCTAFALLIKSLYDISARVALIYWRYCCWFFYSIGNSMPHVYL